ncbi:MAG: CGNR zinc finger domain-containing protein [Solirubrobacteraceae bacterium]
MDNLGDLSSARVWLVDAGGLASEAELAHLHRARAVLQRIVRGELRVSALGPLLRGVTHVPRVEEDIAWTLRVAAERKLAVRVILAWDAIAKNSPGRLRACANDECRLFLIDRSTANRARWCSMAVCGNRMKARRHYQRTHGVETDAGE